MSGPSISNALHLCHSVTVASFMIEFHYGIVGHGWNVVYVQGYKYMWDECLICFIEGWLLPDW